MTYANKFYANFLRAAAQSIEYGIKSLRLREAMLRNARTNDAKNIESVAAFKEEIRISNYNL